MIRAAIFDFDGVIADSLDTTLEIANHYLLAWGDSPMSKSLWRSQDIETLFQSYHINRLQEVFMLWQIRSTIHNRLQNIKVHSHVPPVLTTLSQDISLSVLTSNSPKNVLDFLKFHHLHNYFLTVHGNSFLFNKEKGLSNIINKENLRQDQVVYIGDEPRDIRAAKLAQVKSIAVDWGYSEKRLLQLSQPTAIASSADQLLHQLRQL